MGTDRHFRRYAPESVAQLDLGLHDARIVWATSAKASSKYSSSYSARTACGAPVIYPEGGDESGTWLADRGDDDPWIELKFPKTKGVVGVLVAETCGPGAVFAIVDPKSDEVLWQAKPARISESREARLLHVNIEGDFEALRLRVAPYAFGDEYHEIDGVALITESLEALLGDPPELAPARHRRYPPGEVDLHDLKGDRRILWAHGAKASSEYGSGYEAHAAAGRPSVFPRAGDIRGAWLAEDYDRRDWLEVRFVETDELVHGLLVFETCGAGAVYQAVCEGAALWSAKPEDVKKRSSRMLHVELDAIDAPTKVRLMLAPGEDYRQIDAVALITAPLAALATAAPPPGRDDDWQVLEGELVGEPLAHVTLRTERRAVATNSGGPLRLRLASGEEVPIDTERTTLYGAATVRERGTFAEVRARTPWLTESFEEVGDGRVELLGQRVEAGLAVKVLGEVSFAAAGGFRDAADSTPERVAAAAIATGPHSDQALADHGEAGFEADATKLKARAKALPHPAKRMCVAMFVVAILASFGLAALLLEGAPIDDTLPASALLLVLTATVLGFEFLGRVMWIPEFLASHRATIRDKKVSYSSPGVTVAGTLMVMAPAGGLVTTSMAMMAETDDAPVAAFGVLLAASGLAFVRLALWSWRQGRGTVTALYLLAAGRGRAFPGTLAPGSRFQRTETYSHHSESLGTYQHTDDQGRVTTHERTHTWQERALNGSGPTTVRLVLEDGTHLEATGALRTTHVAIGARPPKKPSDYARFISEHEDGDEVTLFGRASANEAGGMELDEQSPRHLVLGPRSELRRRALVHCLVFVVLLAVAAAGPLFLRTF